MSKQIYSSQKAKLNPTKVRRISEKTCNEGAYETYEISTVATSVGARDIVQLEHVEPFLCDQAKLNPTKVRRTSEKTCDEGAYETYEISTVAASVGARDIVQPKDVDPFCDQGSKDNDMYENLDLLYLRGTKDKVREKGKTDSGYSSATREKKRVKEQKKAQADTYVNMEQSPGLFYHFSVDNRGGLFVLRQIGVSVLVLENNIRAQSNIFVKQHGSDAPPSDNIPNAQLKSKIYEFGPKKLKLREPITVKFPVDFSSHDVHKPSISVCYCSGGEWEELPTHRESTEAYFILGQFCSLKVTRPGRYAVIQRHTASNVHVYANVNSNNNNNDAELESSQPWWATLCVTKIENDQFRATVALQQGIREMPGTFDVRLFQTYNGNGNVAVKLHLNATDAVLAEGFFTKVLTKTQIHDSADITFMLKQKKSCLGPFRISLKQQKSTYCIFPCCADEKIYLEFKGERFQEVKTQQTANKRYTPEPKKDNSMTAENQPYTYATSQSEHKNGRRIYENADVCNEKQKQHPQGNQQTQSQTDVTQQRNIVEHLQRIPVLYVPSATAAKCKQRERVLSNVTKESQNYPFSSAFRNVMNTTLIDTIIQNEAELLSYVEEETCSGGKMSVDYLLQDLFMDISLDWHMVVYRGLVQASSPLSHERKVADVFLLDIRKEKIRANMNRLCNQMKTRMIIERMYSLKRMQEIEKQMVSGSTSPQQQAKKLLEEVVLKSDTEVYECFIEALKDCSCQHLVDLIYIAN